MNASEVVGYCSRRGVSLSVEGGHIRVSGPPSDLNQQLLLLLRAHKPILLRHLSTTTPGDGTETPKNTEEKPGFVSRGVSKDPSVGGEASESTNDCPDWPMDPSLRRWRFVDGPVYRWIDGQLWSPPPGPLAVAAAGQRSTFKPLAGGSGFAPKRVSPEGEPAVEATCGRCGAVGHYTDIPVHDGRSVRRECDCGRVLGFPVWYESRSEGPEK